MDLNSILVSEFAKITNDNKENVNEGTTVYGTYYSPEGGNPYVILDGSNVQTPISSTVEAHPGDRVTVLIKNHKAIVTGNLGDPSASTTTVKKISKKLPEIEQIVKDISDTLLSDSVGYMELIKENIDGVEHLSGFRIMNTPTLTPDTKGWIANKNGIGWSSNGFESISKIGLDMENGRIYADQIAADAIITNSFKIGDCMSFDGPTGSLVAKNLSITGGSINIVTDGTYSPIILSYSNVQTQIDGQNVEVRNVSQNYYGGLNADIIGFYNSGVYSGGLSYNNGYVHLSCNTAYVGEISENGTLLSDKYASKYHDHQYDYAPYTHTHDQYYKSGSNINVREIESLYTYNDTVDYSTNMYIGTSGLLHRTTKTSSRTVKHDIKPIENSDILPEKLYDVDVIQFVYNEGQLGHSSKRYGKELPGFIVEDLVEKYPIAVDIDEEDKPFQWNEQYLIPPMLALIQKQKKKLDELESRINALENKEV